jgi:hypothetical protein
MCAVEGRPCSSDRLLQSPQRCQPAAVPAVRILERWRTGCSLPALVADSPAKQHVSTRWPTPASLAGRVCRAASERLPDGMRQRMFIFGLGYTGLAIANQLQQRGWCGKRSASVERCLPAFELLSLRAWLQIRMSSNIEGSDERKRIHSGVIWLRAGMWREPVATRISARCCGRDTSWRTGSTRTMTKRCGDSLLLPALESCLFVPDIAP